MSEGEVLDVEVEMNRLLEDIPIGLILKDEEMPALETEMLLGTTTEPPPRRSGPPLVLASQQYANANGEGGRSQGMTVGTLARGFPS